MATGTLLVIDVILKHLVCTLDYFGYLSRLSYLSLVDDYLD